VKLPRPPAGAYTRKLRRKFQRSAIERFGLGVVEHDNGAVRIVGTVPVSVDDRRRLRNARKQERKATR